MGVDEIFQEIEEDGAGEGVKAGVQPKACHLCVVSVRGAEQPFPAQEHAEHEERGGLEHAAIAPCPVQAGELSGHEVHFHHLPKGVSAELGIDVCEREYHLLRIGFRMYECIGDFAPFQWLQHEEGSYPGHSLVRKMAHGYQDESEQGIEHQDFAGEEAGVDESEA